MKRTTLSAFIAGACAAITLTASASATITPKLKFPEMVDLAAACVVVKPIASTSETIDGTLYTVTTFEVIETAFGDVGATVKVRSLGGHKKLGKYSVSQVIASSPTVFSLNGHMLFLNSAKNGTHSIVGFSQGLFNVQGSGPNATIGLPVQAGGTISVKKAIETIRDLRAN